MSERDEKPKLVHQQAEIVKLSSAHWERWTPEDVLKEFASFHDRLSDIVIIGRDKEDRNLVIYTSGMSREYAHYLSSKATRILLDEVEHG